MGGFGAAAMVKGVYVQPPPAVQRWRSTGWRVCVMCRPLGRLRNFRNRPHNDQGDAPHDDDDGASRPGRGRGGSLVTGPARPGRGCASVQCPPATTTTRPWSPTTTGAWARRKPAPARPERGPPACCVMETQSRAPRAILSPDCHRGIPGKVPAMNFVACFPCCTRGKVARLAGIEPTTLGFGGQYSIH